jgi:hypothetical protein
MPSFSRRFSSRARSRRSRASRSSRRLLSSTSLRARSTSPRRWYFCGGSALPLRTLPLPLPLATAEAALLSALRLAAISALRKSIEEEGWRW